MDWLLATCRWVHDSTFATALRESAVVYPLVQGSHVLSLGLSVGLVLWFDLRLLGITIRKEPVSNVFEQLRPWMMLGFAVMFVTGAMLFAARAVDAYASTYFRIKIGLLVLGAINIALFHTTIDHARDQWDASAVPPFRARMAGALSIALWFGIIAAGRIMAFNL
jgi:hypothetical protein